MTPNATSGTTDPRTTLSDLEPGRPAQRVVVIGAGMAGLTAAYQLRAGGHDVTVLEARLRPGGRVHTVRAPFADGLYAEAGAMFVPAGHEYLTKYVELFDLEVDPVPPRDLGSYCFVRGTRVLAGAHGTFEGPWPLALSESEQELDLEGMLQRYMGEAAREVGDPLSAGWPPDDVHRFDRLTALEHLRTQGASAEARHLLQTVYLYPWGDHGLSLSALSVLADWEDFSGIAGEQTSSGAWNTIRGGSDRLPYALARHIGDSVEYGAAVVSIEHSPASVSVVFRQATAFRRIEADHVICAIPFSCLREVEISPPFSPEKEYAIKHQRTTSNAHMYLQVRSRIWESQGTGRPAMGGTDLPIGLVRDATHSQDGTRGILDAYTVGPHSRALAAMDPEERLAFTTFHMDRLFPGVAAQVEGGHWHDWETDPWSRGDYVWYKPGEFLRIYPHVASAEGRVHFAGDHTSTRSSWQEGAIYSAHRAAREIHDAAAAPIEQAHDLNAAG